MFIEFFIVLVFIRVFSYTGVVKHLIADLPHNIMIIADTVCCLTFRQGNLAILQHIMLSFNSEVKEGQQFLVLIEKVKQRHSTFRIF
ncbi:hypothetical protein D3C80_1666370 [compost metagenome]